MSIQGVGTPSEPQRRQNSSCDPCRRSKRRCFFSSHSFTDTNASCANCTRLGHTCTFDFASSRLNSRTKKRQRQDSSRPDQTPTYIEQIPFDDSVDTSRRSPNSTSEFISTDTQDDFVAWLNFDIDDYLASDLHSTNAAEPVLPDPKISSESQNERKPSILPTGSQSLQRLSCLEFLPGSSPRSPIHLLNSKLDASILDERLISIYEAILTGSAERFLDCDTNLYATGIRYEIENGGHESSNEPTPATYSSPSDKNGTSSPLNPLNTSGQLQTRMKPDFSGEQTHREASSMTIVGCARFLDHFGDLYGNRLSQASKKRSDTALRAALRLFALQWLPSTGSEIDRRTSPREAAIARLHDKMPLRSSPCEFYTDAWHQARMAIDEARSVRSFRAVFASFIFDGTAIPMSARNNTSEALIEHEFLNIGLQKLHELDELVQNYCAALGPLSQYGALAETSLTLVRWSGYIRDTGAALTSDHQCRLPDPLRDMNTFDRDNSAPPSFFSKSPKECDREIPGICRMMAAEAFFIWRRIADLKNDRRCSYNHPRSLDSEILDSVNSVVNFIETFNKKVRPFIERCRAMFYNLSLPSRVSCVSLIVPWDMGVLVLAESLRADINGIINESGQNFGQPIRRYQREAAFSVAQTARRVLDLPIEEAFNLQNGLASEAPITAYHVTPRIMTTAIEKAVVYFARLQVSKVAGIGNFENRADPIPDDLCHEQIDCLMKGLLSLDVTIGGSQEAGQVLKSLLHEYGDIVSECWSNDFDT